MIFKLSGVINRYWTEKTRHICLYIINGMEGQIKMRKKIYSTMMIIALAAMVTGCGGAKDETSETTTEYVPVTEQGSLATANDSKDNDVDVQAAADEILNNGDFKDTLATVDKTMALTRLYNLDETQIEEAAFYTNSNATAEEIAVIKAASSDYVDTVKAAYETRVSDQEAACRDYLPDEMTKLESAVIYTNGNYVILCVSNDNAKAETIIENLFK